MDAQKGDVTQLLDELTGGNRLVVDQLLPLVYNHLHGLADRQLRSERANHTLSATALIHEAYMKMVDQERVDWKNRSHFLAVASLAMRRILINYANGRLAQKRGGGEVIATYNEEIHGQAARAEELIALDSALSELEQNNERQAKVVQYKFFGGLSLEEIAEVQKVSLATVKRDWRVARAWLAGRLGES